MKIYEVRIYHRGTIFDKNLNLVYRWYYSGCYSFTNKQKALKYFSVYKHYETEKAVLRLKKGGKKRVKR